MGFRGVGLRIGRIFLFQIFRLKVPGEVIDPDDDGFRADDDGKGLCSIFNMISLGLEDHVETCAEE